MTALDLLRAASTPHGFLASPTDRTNYRRVWARDGVICGLAGLASGEADLADGLRTTLDTLAAHRGPHGEIPSNVAVGPRGTTQDVSYGGLAGRVDAGLWYALGVALYVAETDDRAFAARHTEAVSDVFGLMDVWEFNGRGLVYVPQGGDWADEYDLHGYLFFDQILRLAALRAWAHVAFDEPRWHAEADRASAVIEATFWPAPGGDADGAYHSDAYRAEASDAPSHPLAALTPGGYVRRFDALGSALALLCGMWSERSGELAQHAAALAASAPSGLVPAFDPLVQPGDAAWDGLRGNVRDSFSNRPGHYHNGGAWPMVNGWWAVALALTERTEYTEDAQRIADRIAEANAAHGFPEYLDAETGAPGGTRPLAWSAAAELLARAALEGRLDAWGEILGGRVDVEASESCSEAAGLPCDVIVAGEALVDLLSAEPAGDLGQTERFERYVGGSAANLATNLARLGVSTALVASVGDDGFGRYLAQRIARTGVQTRMRIVPDSPTTVAVVTRTSGTPDFALFRHADQRLSRSQLPSAFVRQARLFHTTGFALAREPARTALMDAARTAEAANVALSIDLNVAPRSLAEAVAQREAARAYLALGPLAKASRDDAARLFDEPLSDAETIVRLFDWGAKLVCLTLGADGALVAEPGADPVHVPAAPVESVADATGAGDAFWAGFLAAWLRGAAPAACAEAGGRMAARKLAVVGPLPDRLGADVLV